MSSKMTVREIVQSVLSAMDSDAVNHIGDTIESEQIALIVKETYYEIATYQDVPQFQKLIQLEGLQDLNRRTMMKIPDNCLDIGDVKYLRLKNGREIMEPVRFVEKGQFFEEMWNLDTSNPDVGVNTLPDNIRVPYRTDTYPTCWTTFDDEYITFNAIDITQDDTLHNDASVCMGYMVPEFQMEDDFVPDLPEKMFPQFLQQVKELAFLEHKQSNNPLEREKRKRSEHRNRHLVHIHDGLDNGEARPKSYGRRRGRHIGYSRR